MHFYVHHIQDQTEQIPVRRDDVCLIDRRTLTFLPAVNQSSKEIRWNRKERLHWISPQSKINLICEHHLWETTEYPPPESRQWEGCRRWKIFPLPLSKELGHWRYQFSVSIKYYWLHAVVIACLIEPSHRFQYVHLQHTFWKNWWLHE